MSASVKVPVLTVPYESKSLWVQALESARDDVRRAVARWEKDGDDERSCEEVVIDTLNALIVRGPPQ